MSEVNDHDVLIEIRTKVEVILASIAQTQIDLKDCVKRNEFMPVKNLTYVTMAGVLISIITLVFQK